ncbi:hypothetical protein MNBD_GAMMA24-305 [hydrothermal vent metagenome]|uniref:Inner membrane protein YgaP-like transmembrane domain-containing protein n=1 Tax=hydrothermal vent metagenome TaxID=652676 RepID=A0A3B1B7C9_9ZZZZ
MGIKRNIGWLDFAIRVCVSLVMIYFGFINESLVNDEIARLMLGIFGCLSLLIAIVGFCPVYVLTGFNTCKHKH